MVEQILERAGEGRTVHRACKHDNIGGDDAVDHRRGIVTVSIGCAAVGERNAHVGEVDDVHFERGIGSARRRGHRDERLQQASGGRDTAEHGG